MAVPLLPARVIGNARLRVLARMELLKATHPIDATVTMLAIVGPLTNLPQILKIIETGSSADLSLISWGFYTAYNIPWILYGIRHGKVAVIIASSAWLVSNGVVFTMAFMMA